MENEKLQEQTESMADYEAHFDDANPWNVVARYQEEGTNLHVKVEGIVNGGVIAMVEGLRGFIPASRLSLSYIEDLETYLLKEIDVRVIEANQAEGRLILSAREILREQKKEEDAKKLVEHLRKNNLGRASFLPIASVKGKKLEKLKGNESGVIGIASDLVKFNKKYEQIILNLLGRTVIVDNMNTAIKVAKQNGYTFRIVTKDGDLINPSGAITGGSVAKKTVNILGRGKEIEKLEKEIKNIKAKIQKLEEEKEEYEQSIEGILELSANLEKELQEIDITYATEKQKMISIDENIQKLQNRLNKLKEEQKNLETLKQESIEQKEKIQEETQKITNQNEELSKLISEFAELNKDDQKYIDDLNFDITNLKISVSSFDESESSIQEIQERINQELNNAKASIENKNNQIEQIKVDNENLEKSIQETLNKIEEIKQKVNNSSSEIEKMKQERAQKSEKLSKQEDEITSKFKIIED